LEEGVLRFPEFYGSQLLCEEERSFTVHSCSVRKREFYGSQLLCEEERSA